MSGGHASNPGFSSTTGVLISLKRFDKVTLSADRRTAEIGFGQVCRAGYSHDQCSVGLIFQQGWLDVFKKLDGTGYNVVGGRVPGPGVGGFTLGGGFSWQVHTSKFSRPSQGEGLTDRRSGKPISLVCLASPLRKLADKVAHVARSRLRHCGCLQYGSSCTSRLPFNYFIIFLLMEMDRMEPSPPFHKTRTPICSLR